MTYKKVTQKEPILSFFERIGAAPNSNQSKQSKYFIISQLYLFI